MMKRRFSICQLGLATAVIVLTMCQRVSSSDPYLYPNLPEVDVTMEHHPLNVLRGQEMRVPCTVNRTPEQLGSDSELIFAYARDTSDHWETFARNGELLEVADPEFYDVEVTSSEESTTYTFVFKNPRPIDKGFLRCRLYPRPGLGPRWMLSTGTSRFVLVF